MWRRFHTSLLGGLLRSDDPSPIEEPGTVTDTVADRELPPTSIDVVAQDEQHRRALRTFVRNLESRSNQHVWSQSNFNASS